MRLPQILDLPAAAPLWSELNAQQGKPVELDASGVERLGGQCLQVLLAAKNAWEADGLAFRVAAPSPAFADAWRAMAAPGLQTEEHAS